MIIETRNEGVLVKYLGEFTRNSLGERLSASGLVLPDPEVFLGDPVEETNNQSAEKYPLLIGEVVSHGPGKLLENGERISLIGLEVGQKILYQVNHTHVAYVDPDSKEVLYLIGLGNIFAIVED